MSAIKVSQDYFGSSGRLYGADGLGSVVRAIAIDNARLKLSTLTPLAITDSSTGTAGAEVVDMVIPSRFDASVANGASLTALNTALGKVEDAGKVLVDVMNVIRPSLGLTTLTAASGTAAVAGTIPAQDTAITAASGVTAASYTSGRVALQEAKQNIERLARAANETITALGSTRAPISIRSQGAPGVNLLAITATVASADGSSAMAKAEVDDFMGDVVDNIATIADAWTTALTDAGTAGASLNVVAS